MNGLEVRDNVVAGNGTTDVLPVNGVFILDGEGITIAGNRIVNNGAPAVSDPDKFLRKGIRAGIGVMLAGVRFLEQSLPELATFADVPGASLRILNNTVRQP